jgi:hypothetical protein
MTPETLNTTNLKWHISWNSSNPHKASDKYILFSVSMEQTLSVLNDFSIYEGKKSYTVKWVVNSEDDMTSSKNDTNKRSGESLTSRLKKEVGTVKICFLLYGFDYLR